MRFVPTNSDPMHHVRANISSRHGSLAHHSFSLMHPLSLSLSLSLILSLSLFTHTVCHLISRTHSRTFTIAHTRAQTQMMDLLDSGLKTVSLSFSNLGGSGRPQLSNYLLLLMMKTRIGPSQTPRVKNTFYVFLKFNLLLRQTT